MLRALFWTFSRAHSLGICTPARAGGKEDIVDDVHYSALLFFFLPARPNQSNVLHDCQKAKGVSQEYEPAVLTGLCGTSSVSTSVGNTFFTTVAQQRRCIINLATHLHN